MILQYNVPKIIMLTRIEERSSHNRSKLIVSLLLSLNPGGTNFQNQ
jgi:hypothetical protein